MCETSSVVTDSPRAAPPASTAIPARSTRASSVDKMPRGLSSGCTGIPTEQRTTRSGNHKPIFLIPALVLGRQVPWPRPLFLRGLGHDVAGLGRQTGAFQLDGGVL